jgi:hypothetical protein
MDKQKIAKLIGWAKDNPFKEVRFISNGFGIHAHWDSNDKEFYGRLFFRPGWGHNVKCGGGKTTSEFIDLLESDINEICKRWVHGGKFRRNYYDYQFCT